MAPIRSRIRSRKKFLIYERDYLELPGCTDQSLFPEYQRGNLVRLEKPLIKHYEELLKLIKQVILSKRGYIIIRVSDGEGHFLSGKLVGNGPRRHYTTGTALTADYVKKFHQGLLDCDSRHIEMYVNNQRVFRRLFGKNIFSPIPFECIYALIANKWLLRQSYRIGIIGSDKKIEIIKKLLEHSEYRTYIGRDQFEHYIGVPEKGSSNDVDKLSSAIINQLHPDIDIYLIGIGIAKLAVLPRLKAHSSALFIDVGAGLSALAGLVSNDRPYFSDWINFRLKDYNYETVDRMDAKTTGTQIKYL